jgi:hypothetical protein
MSSSGLFCHCGERIVFGVSIHRFGRWHCSAACVAVHEAKWLDESEPSDD